jgi:hypothetical protein
MASSRLTDDGRCIMTTPGAGYVVGEVLYVLGSGAVYGIAPSDWVLRLVAGYHSNGGGEGVTCGRPTRRCSRRSPTAAFTSRLWRSRARPSRQHPEVHRGTHEAGIPGLPVTPDLRNHADSAQAGG